MYITYANWKTVKYIVYKTLVNNQKCNYLCIYILKISNLRVSKNWITLLIDNYRQNIKIFR